MLLSVLLQMPAPDGARLATAGRGKAAVPEGCRPSSQVEPFTWSAKSGVDEAPDAAGDRQPREAVTPATRSGGAVRVAEAMAGRMSAPPRLRPAYQAGDDRDDEENDRHPEQQLCAAHGRAGDAAEAEEGRDQRDDEENDGPVQKGTHGLLLMCW